MPPDSLTRQWLREHTRFYPDPPLVQAHVEAVLPRHPALRPKTDVYTYDDGRSQLLLCLHGLLPISYRLSSYNIPIALWLTRDYPREPPITYVVASTTILVRSSKHVDVSGRCNTDYIQDWRRKHEGCNLLSLLESLQSHFSREPPVYAKPNDYSSRPPNPIHPASPPSPTRDKPPLPPKPSHVLPGTTSPPPPSTTTPRPHAPPPVNAITSPVHSDSSTQQTQYWPQIYPAVPSNPPPQTLHYPPPVQNFHPPVIQQRNLLDEDVQSPLPQPNLVTAPPRPPNPELLHLYSQIHTKLHSELASLTQATALDAERLRTRRADLLTGGPAIHDEMARLQAVRDVCNSVANRLRGIVDQGERNITELKQKGDPEVDELVCSTTIVHNQLIDLVAEDNAIEDSIYHLHRALNAGRIDLEKFLRTTRALAEEQFMKRALIEKIQLNIPKGSWS